MEIRKRADRPYTRLRGSVAVLCTASSAAWAAACAEVNTETGLVDPDAPDTCCSISTPPYPSRSALIPSIQLWLGRAATIDLSQHYRLDGRPLVFEASSSASDAVQVATSGTALRLDGRALGSAWVTVKGAAWTRLWHVFHVLVVPLSAPPNRGPALLRSTYSSFRDGRIVSNLSARSIRMSSHAPRRVDLTTYFGDPDGDPLTFTAVSEKPDTVAVSVSGDTLILQGSGRGTSWITVTATDPGGLFARGQAGVFVSN